MLACAQELEKFKFVLDYKIKELKKQIEPKEEHIIEMKDQVKVRAMLCHAMLCRAVPMPCYAVLRYAVATLCYTKRALFCSLSLCCTSRLCCAGLDLLSVAHVVVLSSAELS